MNGREIFRHLFKYIPNLMIKYAPDYTQKRVLKQLQQLIADSGGWKGGDQL